MTSSDIPRPFRRGLAALGIVVAICAMAADSISADGDKAAGQTNRWSRSKDLGANWRFARDAEKVPVIRGSVIKRSKTIRPEEGYDTLYCRRFMEDFVEGNFEVIEPDYQADSADDPRLGAQPAKDLPSRGVRRFPTSDAELGWHRCDMVDFRDTDLPPERMDDFFQGLELFGSPPYRVYRVEVNHSQKDGLEDILLAREPVNGWHRYAWVDLKRCEKKASATIGTWFRRAGREYREPLSLLVRYRGDVGVLGYIPYAYGTKNDTNGDATLRFDRLAPRSVCVWTTRAARAR